MILFPLQLTKTYIEEIKKYNVDIYISKSSGSAHNLSDSRKIYVITGTMHTLNDGGGSSLITFHYLGMNFEGDIKIGNEIKHQFIEDESNFACWLKEAIGHLFA